MHIFMQVLLMGRIYFKSLFLFTMQNTNPIGAIVIIIMVNNYSYVLIRKFHWKSKILIYHGIDEMQRVAQIDVHKVI